MMLKFTAKTFKAHELMIGSISYIYIYINHVDPRQSDKSSSVVTICIFRDGELRNTVCHRIHSMHQRYYRSRTAPAPSFWTSPGAFDFFFPSNGCSTSLVAVTVCRGFSVGRLLSARSRGPSCLSGTCLWTDPPHPKCTPRCLHSRDPLWALTMNFCLCKYESSEGTRREVQHFWSARFRGANYNLISVYDNIFCVFAKCTLNFFDVSITRVVFENTVFEWEKRSVRFAIKKLEYKWLFDLNGNVALISAKLLSVHYIACDWLPDFEIFVSALQKKKQL